jgi:zinc protease
MQPARDSIRGWRLKRNTQHNGDLATVAPLPTAAPTPELAELAPVQTWTLASGSRVVVLPMADAPLVCLDLWCRAGSAYERGDEHGMAHFLEHMVFKGSERQAAGAFDLRIEALGGSSNAATGFDDVHYHVLIPPQAVGEACALLLDLVLQPRLAADDFQLERQVVLEELAQSQDQPEEMALQTLLELGCVDHPYGRAILGDRPGLLAHSPERMRQFQQRLYRGEQCVLTVCGGLSPAATTALVEQLQHSPLGQLAAGPPAPLPPAVTVRAGLHRRRFERLEAARLLMAWPLPPAAARAQAMGLDLATSLLAEGRRSRLVARLREELRLVESIDLDLQLLECGSLALLEALCEPADLAEVRGEISRTLEAVIAEPLPADEIERGRRLVANGYRFGLEAPAGVAGHLGNSALWQRPLDLAEPLQLLAAVDGSRLQQESFAWLDPRRACVLEAVPA